MDHEGCTCVICDIPYDESNRKPRMLKCGHSYCSFCLKELLKHQPILCPECRKTLRYKSLEEIPTNYSLLTLLRAIDQRKDDASNSRSTTDVCKAHGGNNLQFR